MDVVAKYDMTADEDEGLVASIALPEGLVGGEFVMVPRSAPSAVAEAEEDDGWLVGYCTHERTLESFCMVRGCMNVRHVHLSVNQRWRQACQHGSKSESTMQALLHALRDHA